MKHFGLLVAVSLIAASLSLGADRPEQTWDSLLAKLESVHVVSGWAVGVAGAPGEFFLLSKSMMAKGTTEDFVGLLKHRLPIVRCMGMKTSAEQRSLLVESLNRKNVDLRVTLAAVSTDYPPTIKWLLDYSWFDFGFVGSHPEVRRALAASLLKISRNLTDDSQPWNTHSDTAFRLAFFIRLDRHLLREHIIDTEILTEAERSEIEKNIEPFVTKPAPK